MLKHLFPILCLAIMFLTSCATAPGPLPAGSRQRTGQIHYTGNGKSVVADIVFQQSGNDIAARINKGPSSQLLSILTVGDDAVHVSGPLVPIRWRGKPQSAPGGLKVFALLPQAFLDAVQRGSTRQFSVESDGSRIVCQLTP